jgi:hypothetical protein
MLAMASVERSQGPLSSFYPLTVNKRFLLKLPSHTLYHIPLSQKANIFS